MKIKWEGVEKEQEFSIISFDGTRFEFKGWEIDMIMWVYKGRMFFFGVFDEKFWGTLFSYEIVGTFNDEYPIYSVMRNEEEVTPKLRLAADNHYKDFGYVHVLHINELFERVRIWDYNEDVVYELV